MADSVDPRPVRDQVTDALRKQIERGELAPGDPLPSQRALADEHGISVSTAKAALAELRRAGLVTSRHGSGVYVRSHETQIRVSYLHEQEEKRFALEPADARGREGASERTMGRSIDDLKFQPHYQRVSPPEDVATRLELSTDDTVLQRTYQSWSFETGLLEQWSRSWLPLGLISHEPRLLDQSEEPFPGGTHAQLRLAGLEAMRVISRVVDRRPTQQELHDWGLTGDTHMLETRNTTYDGNNRPLLTAIAVFPADRTELEYATELPKW